MKTNDKFIVDNRFFENVAIVHKQSKVEIPATGDARQNILTAFNDGEEIMNLISASGEYSKDHDRIYPLYDEESGYTEGKYDHFEIEDILGQMNYYWLIINTTPRLDNLVHSYNEMVNIINDLASWHHGYDSDRGEITTG